MSEPELFRLPKPIGSGDMVAGLFAIDDLSVRTPVIDPANETFRPSGYVVRRIPFRQAAALCKAGHYTRSGGKVSGNCFGLFLHGALVGVAIYAMPSGRLVSASLWEGGADTNTLELTRLFIADGTGRNAESWFLARTMNQLAAQYELIVAYSAPDAGHHGGCYQASNWLYLGRGTGQCHYHYTNGDGAYVNKRVPWDLYARNRGTFASERAAAEFLQLTRHEEERKYVYVYPRSRRARRRLKRDILPYPKPAEVAA